MNFKTFCGVHNSKTANDRVFNTTMNKLLYTSILFSSRKLSKTGPLPSSHSFQITSIQAFYLPFKYVLKFSPPLSILKVVLLASGHFCFLLIVRSMRAVNWIRNCLRRMLTREEVICCFSTQLGLDLTILS